MAITEFKIANSNTFVGLSTDTKSTGASNGDFFLETDTGSQFIFNGAWVTYTNILVNTDSTVQTLTAASVGVASIDQKNFNGKGILVGVNITALTGTTPTLTVTLQGKDLASGVYYTVLASAALSATGFTLLSVYPGLVAAANLTVNSPLPKTWRISSVIGGTTPAVTATIGASVIM
jgi:hypothetical protein